MKNTRKTILIGLVLALLAWTGGRALVDLWGLESWLDSRGGKPRVVVDLIVPNNVTLSCNFHEVGNRRGRRANKYKRHAAIKREVKRSAEKQRISFPLPPDKTIDRFQLVFSDAEISAAKSSENPEEIYQNRQASIIYRISLINGEQQIEWRGNGISAAFQLNKPLQKHKATEDELRFSLKRRKAILELSETIEVKAVGKKEQHRAQTWLVHLIPLLASGLLFLITFLFRTKLEPAPTYSLLFAAFFLALVLFPHADIGYSKKHFSENNEKRTLNERPDWDWASWSEYPKQFEAYYKDQFGFRKPLIKINSLFKVKILGVSSAPDEVILGKETWLYKANFRPDYEGRILYSENRLEKICQKFIAIQQLCKSKGIQYYLHLNPDKYSIYPEHLPDWVQKVNEQRRLDQLVTYAQTHYPELHLIDSRPEILQAKTIDRLYNKHDLHWNELGAFIDYQKLLREIGKDFPQLKPYKLSDYNQKKRLVFKGGLSKMLSIEKSYYEERISLKPKYEKQHKRIRAKGFPPMTVITQQSNAELPKAVVFRDSFFGNLIPHFSEHFSRVVYIKNANRKGQSGIDRAMVEREKPDILIHQMAECGNLELQRY